VIHLKVDDQEDVVDAFGRIASSDWQEIRESTERMTKS
jgi:hypothetical protein